ncbi:hypothetical protein Tco_0015848 [Tanacetum coccineum]
MPLVEQSGSSPNLSHFKHLRVADEPPMTYEEAVQMMEEQKRLANLRAIRADNLPITGFKYHIETNKHNTQFMKNLAAIFKWVKETVEKLDIPPSHQLTQVGSPPPVVRRKKHPRFAISEVFVTNEPLVDRIGRNLIPPKGVITGTSGQVLKHLEPGILYLNGNWELSFQGVSEFKLASLVQLLSIHSLIVQDSDYAKLVLLS